MSLPAHHLELLAPAKTADIGREAVLHGADAVYIGGPAFGARGKAENSVADVAALVAFAHRYRVRIFVALNTILHDAELEPARRLVWELYDAGVDALIVQDMGLLQLDLPPIQLHASTQCDIRSPAKAHFLAHSGFSQLVLARELSLSEIAAVRAAVPDDTTLEYFIHGALCVAFSGQCYISHAHTGRSANRGDCSQACRLPYTLEDAGGRIVAFDKHLLSMKDNDQSANLDALVDAGIRSFKIEGRYKDLGYVKNVTGHYRRQLDALMARRPEFAPASSGRTQLGFSPDPAKTYNRSSTDYFTQGRQADIGAFDSPTYLGSVLGEVRAIGPDWFELASREPLANGDGLAYLHKRASVGLRVNVAERRDTGTDVVQLWRVHPNEPVASLPGLRVGLTLSRNRDHAWDQRMAHKSAERRIALRACLRETASGYALALEDADGFHGRSEIACNKLPAQQPDKASAALAEQIGRLGNTLFVLEHFECDWLDAPQFLPASSANALRREAVAALEAARTAGWQRPPRKAETQPPLPYPERSLSYLANVYNQAARAFYARHGVALIEAAYEAGERDDEVSLMITKHCLRYAFQLCPKQAKGVQGVQGQVSAEPMTLVNGEDRLTLRFDCKPCEMHVMGRRR